MWQLVVNWMSDHLHLSIYKVKHLSCVNLELTSNIFPVLEKAAFFSLLRVNSTVSVTLPGFSSNTKLSPNLEGPGEAPAPPPPLLPRSLRASSIRLRFLPLNALSVFMCLLLGATVAVGVPPGQHSLNTSSSEGSMETSCASAARASG